MPEEKLRLAILCSKKTVPSLKVDLNLCRQSKEVEAKSCDTKVLNLESALRNTPKPVKFSTWVTLFFAGAVSGLVVALAITK